VLGIAINHPEPVKNNDHGLSGEDAINSEIQGVQFNANIIHVYLVVYPIIPDK
jgi:hypothetical protein